MGWIPGNQYVAASIGHRWDEGKEPLHLSFHLSSVSQSCIPRNEEDQKPKPIYNPTYNAIDKEALKGGHRSVFKFKEEEGECI